MNWTKNGCVPFAYTKTNVPSPWKVSDSMPVIISIWTNSTFHFFTTHKIPLSKHYTVIVSSLFSHHFSTVAFWQSPGQTAFPYILWFPERFTSSSFAWHTKYWLESHPNINIACKTLTVQKKIWLTTTESYCFVRNKFTHKIPGCYKYHET